MANRGSDLPTAHALRFYGLKYEVDPRTILRVLKGEKVRGERTKRAAERAAEEWQENNSKPARKRARAK